MTPNIEQELTRLNQGDHICLIYENPAEQLAVVVPFIMDGLDRGERCLYIADGRIFDEVVQALAAAGVDIAQAYQRGALRLSTSKETYLRAGEFVPQSMIDLIRQAETEALADGFAGLRLIGEPTWSFGPEPGCDRLIEYEALINQLPSFSKSVILCQYHQSRFGVPCIHDVLRTHPVAILGDQVCPNPYYESPELVLRKDQPGMTPNFTAKRVDWWIAQFKRARAAEQARERALDELKLSERRLAEAQMVAHIGSWERDLRTNQVTWTDELYRLFGLRSHQGNISYQKFLDFVLPQDADRIRTLADETIRERRHFDCDYRISLPDGSVRVLNDRGSVVLDKEGEPIRLVGTAQDVTELRQVEHARKEYTDRLQALSRRLLEVQEEERRHLARELHDEVGQTLTGLGLILNPSADVTTDAARAGFQQARALVDNLLKTVRQLSFDLRAAELDQLGLLPGLLAHFERYSQQTGALVNFKHQGVDGRFAPEVETTAYRIVQEALTNVARHAGVVVVCVRVWAAADTLNIQVEDRGRGFDLEAVLRTARSGGLPGMQERVTLLGGLLTIESRPGAGTQITAELPLAEAGGEP
jgi:PAS domain S-box-containing protein